MKHYSACGTLNKCCNDGHAILTLMGNRNINQPGINSDEINLDDIEFTV